MATRFGGIECDGLECQNGKKIMQALYPLNVEKMKVLPISSPDRLGLKLRKRIETEKSIKPCRFHLIVDWAWEEYISE